MAESGTPVVFIHGLWLHASSWEPWVELFRQRGYDPIAPGWPGEPATLAEARANPGSMGGFGITAVAEHYASIIRTLPTPPILIGHSFGGLLVQNLLGRDLAKAAVAIDPAPIKGVLSLPVSALRVASVALRNPANYKGAVALTPAQFNYGFANELPQAEADELFATVTMASPGRPLFEAATANFNPSSPAKVAVDHVGRGPLLLIAGGKDHTVPAVVVKSTRKLYRHTAAVTDLIEFPDRGHSLTLDHGWREVADSVLDWLEKQSL